MNITREKNKVLNCWIWKADFRYKKKRYRVKAFSKDALETKIIEIKSAKPDNTPQITLGELAREKIKSLDLTVAAERRRKLLIESFQKITGADTLIVDIKTAHLSAWLESVHEKHKKTGGARLSPYSVNKYLGMVTSLLRWSSDRFPELNDYVPPRAPWAKTPRGAKERTISNSERRKLLEYLRFEGRHPDKRPNRFETVRDRKARFEYADMFEIALLTAMRWGEIKLLKWHWIDFEKKILILSPEVTKTGEERIVYLNSRAVEILAARRTEGVYVFASSLHPDRPRKSFYEGIRRVCEKLKLPFSRDGFTLHTTRHTSVSEILEKTGDFAAAQAQAGHSDAYMTTRYAHARRDKMHEIMENLVDK